jgi:hypothetical protein
MGDKATNSNTVRAITYYITKWMYNEESESIQTIVPDASNELIKAIQEQNELGWKNFIKARLTDTWETLYSEDRKNNIDTTHRTPTPETWGRDIIHIMWTFILDIWYCCHDTERLDVLMNQIVHLVQLLMQLDLKHI